MNNNSGEVESVTLKSLALLFNPFLSSWSPSSLPCNNGTSNSTWVGVTCNAFGRVTGITMRDKNYSGEFAAIFVNITSFTYLLKLDLSNNAFFGITFFSFNKILYMFWDF
jgi:hypothetical protein